MDTIEVDTYKELVQQLIKFQENQVMILQKLANLVPKSDIVENIILNNNSLQSTSLEDALINAKEIAEFGGEEMSESELAEIFGEMETEHRHFKPLNKMTIQEITLLEKAEDNSNDIYKIKARIANLARRSGASLTPQGEQMVNTYVHVIKSFYDFAETLSNSTEKNKLINLIKLNEDMPANLIIAAGIGLRQNK